MSFCDNMSSLPYKICYTSMRPGNWKMCAINTERVQVNKAANCHTATPNQIDDRKNPYVYQLQEKKVNIEENLPDLYEVLMAEWLEQAFQ